MKRIWSNEVRLVADEWEGIYRKFDLEPWRNFHGRIIFWGKMFSYSGDFWDHVLGNDDDSRNQPTL